MVDYTLRQRLVTQLTAGEPVIVDQYAPGAKDELFELQQLVREGKVNWLVHEMDDQQSRLIFRWNFENLYGGDRG